MYSHGQVGTSASFSVFTTYLNKLYIQQVSQLDGVYAVQEPHFWTLCSDVYVGSVKVEVSPKADARYITTQTHSIFAQVGDPFTTYLIT